MMRALLITLLTLTLFGCAYHRTSCPAQPEPATPNPRNSVMDRPYLEQGKRFFQDGYYRRAMNELLPLACDGNAEAQYAVGYMYYYGYGVTQDTDVGYFWINRSADQGFAPATVAVSMMQQKENRKAARYPSRYNY